jgi:alcohol dehydrogenase (cytochrome c)
VFRGLVDGHVLALDAKTGEFYTAAPLVWDGGVYFGNAGSDYSGIGHIRAFDAKTGSRLWSFGTVSSTGDAAKTWPDDPKRVKAGGGTYSSYALDTEAGLLYSPVGNPGPDFVRSYRHGDNLYTSSVVVLDGKTGELKGYHQLVTNDFHDWDVAASPILFTSKAGRKMVAAAGKNGYLYGLSRDLKDVFFQTPVTRIENVDAPLTPEGTRFLPGTQGGANWYGPSCLSVVQRIGDQDPKDQRFGHVTAVDADSGQVLWKYDTDTSMVASVTPTAGGVLTGDTKGNFLVFDAASGHVLLKKDLGDPIGGGISTYMLDGTQYVAVVGA